MKLFKCLGKIGLSVHDGLILFSLLETAWWIMYAFSDGADVLTRLQDNESEILKREIHPFMLFQRFVSLAKAVLTILLIWYGSIFLGKSRPIRFYLCTGIFLDVIVIIAWIFLAVEEAWTLKLENLYGIHYIITFIVFRIGVYCVLRLLVNEIFIAPFGTSVVGIGTATETVVGVPERGIGPINSGNNLSFFGKGGLMFLQHYRIQTEKAFLIGASWEILWNLSIIISQEVPELIFDELFIGPCGSLPMMLPSESLFVRSIRVILGATAIAIVHWKNIRYTLIWISIYFSHFVLGAIFFCFILVTTAIDETTIVTIIVIIVFFVSNGVKLIFLILAGRFYFQLRKVNTQLINENVNNNA